MRNLISKWSKPEMKNSTARITITKRTAGLILEPEDEGFESLWKTVLVVDGEDNEEGERGGGKSFGTHDDIFKWLCSSINHLFFLLLTSLPKIIFSLTYKIQKQTQHIFQTKVVFLKYLAFCFTFARSKIIEAASRRVLEVNFEKEKKKLKASLYVSYIIK
jgi:hypothetical protein